MKQGIFLDLLHTLQRRNKENAWMKFKHWRKCDEDAGARMWPSVECCLRQTYYAVTSFLLSKAEKDSILDYRHLSDRKNPRWQIDWEIIHSFAGNVSFLSLSAIEITWVWLMKIRSTFPVLFDERICIIFENLYKVLNVLTYYTLLCNFTYYMFLKMEIFNQFFIHRLMY